MSSVQGGHPLPAPPGQGDQDLRYQQQPLQRPVQTRPRSKSSFSFRSEKSHKSQGSAGKIDLHETHAEKQSRRLQSKADPTLAISEAEPSAVASMTASKLAPLRAIQHRDSLGNAIADPDRSNPTRSRWERPLDTIRSFEAAIDGNYSRKSMQRSESSNSIAGYNTRRSSYHAGSNVGSNVGSQAPRQNDGYFGARSAAQRPESYYDGGIDSRAAGPSNGYYPQRQRYPRTACEPVFNNYGNGVYPNNANGQSYETVTTASGSGGSYAEPAGYQTDPSSENSSIDRIQASEGAYGYNGYEGGPVQPQMRNYQSNGYGGPGADMPMIHESGQQYQAGRQGRVPPRVPIKLSAGAAPDSSDFGVYEPPKPTKDKRKSWLSRRFSKN